MNTHEQTRRREARADAQMTAWTAQRPVHVPRTDVYETDDAFLVTADMPGAEEGAVNVTLEQDVLTLEARAASGEPPGYELAHREYSAGDYRRQFTLAAEIDRDRIEATLRDGVLRVSLPKAARAKSRKITVKAGG